MNNKKATYNGQRLRPSEYLGGVDVAERDLTGTISRIEPRHKCHGREMPVLALEVAGLGQRFLRINAANEDSLCRLYGTKAKEWIGKSVVLYHDPSVSFGGKSVGGVRIRQDGKARQRQGEPDQQVSTKITEALSMRLFAAASKDHLDSIATEIKQSASKITSADLARLRGEFKAAQDGLAEFPVVPPEDVDGPFDYGPPDWDQETGEIE